MANLIGISCNNGSDDISNKLDEIFQDKAIIVSYLDPVQVLVNLVGKEETEIRDNNGNPVKVSSGELFCVLEDDLLSRVPGFYDNALRNTLLDLEAESPDVPIVVTDLPCEGTRTIRELGGTVVHIDPYPGQALEFGKQDVAVFSDALDHLIRNHFSEVWA
jgi:hypothetical protein